MDARLTPARLVYDLVHGGDPQVSPDGSRLVFTRSACTAARQARTHLWLCAIDGADPRQLTHSGSANTLPRWAPDGERIAFVSDRDGGSGIFVLQPGPGEATPVTRHTRGIQALSWSPDGTRLAYVTADDPDAAPRASDAPAPVRVARRDDYRVDGRGWVGDERAHLWIVDVASGERRRLSQAPNDHHAPDWSPDGTRIAIHLPNRSGICSQLGIVDVATGGLTVFGPELGTVATWGWLPDSSGLLIAGDTTQRWQSDLHHHDLATGDTRTLVDDLDILPDGADAGALLLPQADGSVLFHGIRHARSGIYRWRPATGEVALVAQTEGLNVGLSADRAGRFLAQAHSGFGAVGEIAITDTAAGTMRIVTTHNRDALAATPPASAERFTIERGGETIEAWLLHPGDFDPGRAYPLVIDIHGGPNWFYGPDFDAQRQALAAAGYLVLICNPRGSTTYGRRFTNLVVGDWAGEDLQDLYAALESACQRPYVDRARLGVYGYSYGGYMVSWILGQTHPFRAAVCGAPAFDLATMYGSSDIGRIFADLHWGGGPQAGHPIYTTRNPATHAHRATIPTLVFCGEADVRCPITQAEHLYSVLNAAGVETEFARYPDSAHLFPWTGHPAYRVDVLGRVIAWFDRHL